MSSNKPEIKRSGPGLTLAGQLLLPKSYEEIRRIEKRIKKEVWANLGALSLLSLEEILQDINAKANVNPLERGPIYQKPGRGKGQVVGYNLTYVESARRLQPLTQLLRKSVPIIARNNLQIAFENIPAESGADPEKIAPHMAFMRPCNIELPSIHEDIGGMLPAPSQVLGPERRDLKIPPHYR